MTVSDNQAMSGADDQREGVPLSNLDQELFDGAGSTKRHLVDYLDAVSDAILPALRDRPLSVVRIRPGQPAFMQKNLPNYAPEWVKTVSVWAEASKREVSYALCNDRRTLLWFANQRAVEYPRDAVPSARLEQSDPSRDGPGSAGRRWVLRGRPRRATGPPGA